MTHPPSYRTEGRLLKSPETCILTVNEAQCADARAGVWQISLSLKTFFSGYLEGREYDTEGRSLFANYPAMLKLKDWPPRVSEPSRSEAVLDRLAGLPKSARAKSQLTCAVQKLRVAMRLLTCGGKGLWPGRSTLKIDPESRSEKPDSLCCKVRQPRALLHAAFAFAW